MTTITSRYFNQHTSKVQKAAERAPVIITRRGEPSHVLMSIADFRRLAANAEGATGEPATSTARNAYEYLTPSNPAVADTELEIPPRPPRPGSLLEYLMNADHPDVSDIELEIPPRSKAQRRPVEF